MGETMMCRYGALSALRLATAVAAAILSTSARAADLPELKLSDANPVPACATPGRLMAFIEGRNKGLPEKFQTISADYMRIGEELGVRWDTALFQMLLETGNLTFTGDVSVDQNNFAGLGATGKKEPGESFPDVATGVRAHLEHLMLYAGDPPANPVAERTRKVKEWGVLDSWQKSVKGPMTFSLIAKKWAPGSRNYARDIEDVANAFYNGPCKGADPKPEMMALAKSGQSKKAGAEAKVAEAQKPSETAVADDASESKVSGAELARRAVAEARASGSFVRSNLGAGTLAKTAEDTQAKAPVVGEAPSEKPAFKIINAQADAQTAAEPAASDGEAAPPAEAEADQPEPQPSAKMSPTAAALPAAKTALNAKTQAKEPIRTAALGAGTKPAVTTATDATPAEGLKCRVWTASYGGSRAILIKAAGESIVNYTVLDVNEGTEKREADAYIAAYAKGGKQVGEYQNQTQALDKAFELCPEG